MSVLRQYLILILAMIRNRWRWGWPGKKREVWPWRAWPGVEPAAARDAAAASEGARRVTVTMRSDGRTYGEILDAFESSGGRLKNWSDPTEEMLKSPRFEAVWQCIKDWDIAVPGAYGGYCGATGNHVRAILDAQDAAAARERE